MAVFSDSLFSRAVGAFLVICLGFFVWSFSNNIPPETGAVAFFSDILGNTGKDTVVVIHDTPYLIRNGDVVEPADSPITERRRAEILGLAYGLEYAAHAAPLRLEGSELRALPHLLDQLADASERLSTLQTTEAARKRVRNDLYPIEFLRTLEKLEIARRTFIRSRSDQTGAVYFDLLTRTLRQAIQAQERFAKAFEAAAGPYKKAVPGGFLTKQKTISTLREIGTFYQDLVHETADMKECLYGKASACAPLPSPIPVEKFLQQKDEVSMRRVVSLFTKAYATLEQGAPLTVVALRESACVDGDNTSKYVLAIPRGQGDLTTYWYVGDFFFQPLTASSTGRTLSWFKESGVSYLMTNPLTFYNCPQVGADIARVKSIIQMEEYLSSSKRTGDYSVLYEHEVLDTLSAELVEAIRTQRIEQINTIRALTETYQSYTTGFEDVIYDVVAGLNAILSMHTQGIEVDTDEEFLFETHSGYYSLLLTYTLTTKNKSLPLEEDPSDVYRNNFVTFSSLTNRVPIEKLMQDISVFLKVHR